MGNHSATNEQSATKKMPTKKLAVIAVVAVIVLAVGACWYACFRAPYENAVKAFDEAADGLNERNMELDASIAELQDLVGTGGTPLDSATLDVANAVVSEAQGAKQEIPAMPDDTEEIALLAVDMEGMGNYAVQLESIAAAQASLQDSIDQLKQVTNPSEQFVIERLTGLPNITGIEAATEQNDPNGHLHKDGGYTSAVFFSSDLVDQSEVYPNEGFTGIPAAGTDGGGCVEVYATVEDAEERNTYLSAFDGSILRPGSYAVLGTCVVRTSDFLTASQQDGLEGSIVDSLTRLE